MQALAAFQAGGIVDTGAVESVIATLPAAEVGASANKQVPINNPNSTPLIIIRGVIVIAAGASATQINVRVRKDDVNGAQVGSTIGVQVTPGLSTTIPIAVIDNSGTAQKPGGQVYAVTLTELNATANGNASFVSLTAEAFTRSP